MFRNTKKLFSLLLVLTMLCSLAVPAFAEDDIGDSGEPILPPELPTATLNCGDAAPGRTAECSLAIDGAFTFATLTATIEYDSEKLTFNTVSLSEESGLNSECFDFDNETYSDKLLITYIGAEDIEFAGGKLFDFSFDVVDPWPADAREYVVIKADLVATTADLSEFELEVKGDKKISVKTLFEIEVFSEDNTFGIVEKSADVACQGENIRITAIPKEGYRFAGWDPTPNTLKFADANSRDTTFVMPNSSVTIYAKFTKTNAATRYSIEEGELVGGSFKSRVVDRTAIRDQSNATEDSKVLLLATPSAGYYLKGWDVRTWRGKKVDVYEDGSSVAQIVMPSDDIIVTPIFEKCEENEYSLTIHTSGFGTASSEARKYVPGDLVVIEASADDEYQFGEWSTPSEAVEFTRSTSSHTTFEMPAEDVVITANFVDGEEKFLISFQNVGGGTSATKNGKTEFYEGDKVTIVATPRTGYRFYGWTTGGLSGVKFANEYSSTTTFTMPSKNVVITANFVEFGSGSIDGGSSTGNAGGTGTIPAAGAQYQVVFNSTGGSSVPTTQVSANAFLAQPAPPTRSGYFFAGWYIDSACTVKYDFQQPVTHHLTLYAKWSDSLSFTDVNKSAWYYEPITYLAQNGVISGLSSTTFAPNATITRAQVAQILANLSGANLSRYTYVPFEDVLLDAWYFNAVAWAIDRGVIQGTSPTTFAPNAPITRQDLAVLIHRYITNVSGSILPLSQAAKTFADQTQIADYAKAAVTAMQRAQIINGKENNRFDPRGNATRAEASKMIYQLMTLIG